MATVRASVIIPARNADRTIGAAIRSVLSQTLRDLEIIVVDDGSDDSTCAVVQAFDDPRITLLRHERSRGVSAARNTAIQVAKGAWLAPLDADDTYSRDRLERLVEEAERDDLDIIIDNLNRIDATSGKSIGVAFPPEWYCSDKMSYSEPVERDVPYKQKVGIGFCKPVFRALFFREVIGGYDERFKCAEDLLVLQTALLNSARARMVDVASYNYTVSSSSHSNNASAYKDISRVNQEIIKRAARRVTMAGFLKDRQIIIDFDAACKRLRCRDIVGAMYFVRQLPPHFLLAQAARVLGRLLGLNVLDFLNPNNPKWMRSVCVD